MNHENIYNLHYFIVILLPKGLSVLFINFGLIFSCDL